MVIGTSTVICKLSVAKPNLSVQSTPGWNLADKLATAVAEILHEYLLERSPLRARAVCGTISNVLLVKMNVIQLTYSASNPSIEYKKI